MQNESQNVVVTLSQPVEVHGEIVTELTLVRPIGKHLKVMDEVKGEQAQALRLIAALASVPPSIIDNLPLEDVLNLTEAVAPFLRRTQKIGETSTDI